jgi:hypothetical protein
MAKTFNILKNMSKNKINSELIMKHRTAEKMCKIFAIVMIVLQILLKTIQKPCWMLTFT